MSLPHDVRHGGLKLTAIGVVIGAIRALRVDPIAALRAEWSEGQRLLTFDLCRL